MLIKPHGGKLINRRATEVEAEEIRQNIDFEYEIDEETAKDLINIADGVYSPLEGFMNEDDFVSVVEKKTLASGDVWTIPKYLAIDPDQNEQFKIGSVVLLTNKKLGVEASLNIESKYTYNLDQYGEQVFGTSSTDHPGVAFSFDRNQILVGGEIRLLKEKNRIFPDFNYKPAQTREIFADKGWSKIVGFQTRNAPHLAHEFIQKLALEFVDGLFINPIMGKKKPGDFRDEVILNVYEALTAEFYPDNSTFLGIFPAKMNYAGPREAVFHALVRKNYGCSHFIVGRDHAGVGDYYDSLAAHRIFEDIGEIDVEIMKFSHAFYSKKSRMFTTQKVSPFTDPEDRIAPSGTKVRGLIKDGKVEELEKFMRREIIEIILDYDNPFVAK